jgi:hypothetical protein
MANKRYSEVHPCHGEEDSDKDVKWPSSKGKPSEANFEQHPHHTGPKVDGPGKVPKA